MTVQDHGVGIAAENLQHIFEGFFHTQDTDRYSSKRPFAFDAGGKGLDLLKIRSYTDRYGWDLEVESERCRFIPTDSHVCPGRVSACGACTTRDDCLENGRTTFRLMVPQTMTSERGYEPRTTVRQMRRVQRSPESAQ